MKPWCPRTWCLRSPNKHTLDVPVTMAKNPGTKPPVPLAKPRLLSSEDVAEYLGVPLGTVYRWRSRGEGPAGYRVGRHVRYKLADLEHWLERRRDDPATEAS